MAGTDLNHVHAHQAVALVETQLHESIGFARAGGQVHQVAVAIVAHLCTGQDFVRKADDGGIGIPSLFLSLSGQLAGPMEFL